MGVDEDEMYRLAFSEAGRQVDFLLSTIERVRVRSGLLLASTLVASGQSVAFGHNALLTALALATYAGGLVFGMLVLFPKVELPHSIDPSAVTRQYQSQNETADAYAKLIWLRQQMSKTLLDQLRQIKSALVWQFAAAVLGTCVWGIPTMIQAIANQ